MSATEVAALRDPGAALAHKHLHAFDTFDLRLPPRVESGLSACFEAFRYAEDLDCDPWNFAVEYSTLRRLTLSRCDLRWLVAKGWLDCAIEISLPGDSERRFERTLRPIFGKTTCFVLTSQGVELSRLLNGHDRDHDPSYRHVVDSPVSRSLSSDRKLPVPQWDRDRQVLRIGHLVVKQFKVPAVNQETVLMAFEEEAWPPRIDDPLPPHRERSPKRRLQETIKSLNRNQERPLIHFIGDGSGTGVRWEFCSTIRLPRQT